MKLTKREYTSNCWVCYSPTDLCDGNGQWLCEGICAQGVYVSGVVSKLDIIAASLSSIENELSDLSYKLGAIGPAIDRLATALVDSIADQVLTSITRKSVE